MEPTSSPEQAYLAPAPQEVEAGKVRGPGAHGSPCPHGPGGDEGVDCARSAFSLLSPPGCPARHCTHAADGLDCGCGDARGPVLEPPPAALVPSTEKPSWTRFTRRSHPKPRCAESKEPTKLLGKRGLKTFLPRQGTRNQPWDLTLVSPEADDGFVTRATHV